MGYYRGDCGHNYQAGDYYRGDYYRGDSIFSKIGKGIGAVAKAAVSLLPGPVGTVARAVTGIGTGKVGVGPASAFPSPPILTYLPPGAGNPPGLGPMIPQGPVGTMLPSGFIPGCQLKGTRPNKSGYYKQVVKGQPANVIFIPKGSVCVKSRRLNVANPRALRRAIRRAQGFSKLARRVMTFVNARAPKGRAKFKRKR